MHGLQHLDHLRRGAAVEVVDVEHDAIDRPLWVIGASAAPAPFLHKLVELLEVLADRGDQAELPAVGVARSSLRDEAVQPLAGGELGKLAGELAHLLDDIVELCLQHALVRLGLEQCRALLCDGGLLPAPQPIGDLAEQARAGPQSCGDGGCGGQQSEHRSAGAGEILRGRDASDDRHRRDRDARGERPARHAGDGSPCGVDVLRSLLKLLGEHFDPLGVGGARRAGLAPV